MSMKELVEQYESKGWREECHFPGEYVLLMNERLDKVRVYENGAVWESDPDTGEYIKVKEME
jgi:hypothetical protein